MRRVDAEHQLGARSDATLTEWKAFSTGLTTVEVIDGDHDSIVRGPAIRLTALSLLQRLSSR